MFLSKEQYDILIELAHNGEKYERLCNEIISKWKDTMELNGNILAHLSSLESQNNMLIKQNNSLHEQLINMFPNLNPHIYATSIYDESNLQGVTSDD